MSFLSLRKHWGHPEKLARENGPPGQEQKHVVCGTDARLRMTELATAFLGRKYFSRKARVLSGTLRYRISEYCDQRCYDSWREDGPCWLWTFPALPSLLGCASSELKTETHSQCCHLHVDVRQAKVTIKTDLYLPCPVLPLSLPPSPNHLAPYPPRGQARLRIPFWTPPLATPLILACSLPTLFMRTLWATASIFRSLFRLFFFYDILSCIT